MGIMTTIFYLSLDIFKIIIVSFLCNFFFKIVSKKLNSIQILHQLRIFPIASLNRFILKIKFVFKLLLNCHSFFFGCISFINKDSHTFYFAIDLRNLVKIVINHVSKILKLLFKCIELFDRGKFSHKLLKLDYFFFFTVFLFARLFEVVVHIQRNFILNTNFHIIYL